MAVRSSSASQWRRTADLQSSRAQAKQQRWFWILLGANLVFLSVLLDAGAGAAVIDDGHVNADSRMPDPLEASSTTSTTSTTSISTTSTMMTTPAWTTTSMPCAICPGGTFSNQSAVNCTGNGQCAPGSCREAKNGQGYVPPGGTQATYCTRCPRGKFSNGNATACEFCADGYEPDATAASCQRCSRGEVSSPGETGGFCVQCLQKHPGWIANQVQSECESCSPGMNSTTGSSCTLCGLGYFWNATLRNCPKLCPIGHACHNKSLANGEAYCDQCNPCEPGSFSSFSGSYSCTLCAPGAYQSEAGQDHCQQCESGTYQTERGQKVCDVCPAGFYCPDGHTIKPCPEGKYCPQRSTVPKTCPSMFRATSKSCEFTQRLIAIIVCSCLAGVAVVAMIVYRRYKTYSRHRHDESARLIEKNQIKRPVYSGL